MKRNQALELIANQLDYLAGKFQGARTNFSEEELAKADVILTTLEEAGMMPPKVILKDPGHFQGDEFSYESNTWESEA